MPNYFISVGGTGAKVLESFVYLNASNLGIEGDVNVLIVDSDTANKLVTRANEAINNYKKCKNDLNLTNKEIFKTSFEKLHSDKSWNPVPKENTNSEGNNVSTRIKNLHALYKYNLLHPKNQHIFDILYSEKEKTTKLDGGFRGHPCIGNAIFSNSVNFDIDPWKKLVEQIEQELKNENSGQIKIFICGSIFGGMGASGIPTIARLLKQKLNNEKIYIGGLLVLPYFTFITKKDEYKDEMRAYSENFNLNTKAALEYYHSQNYHEYFNKIYFLGDPTNSQDVPDAPYGILQNNKANVIEFYGALSSLHFFNYKMTSGDNSSNSINLTCNFGNDKIFWNDCQVILEHPKDVNVHKELLKFLNFSYSYLDIYYDIFIDYKDKKNYQYPFLIDIFKGYNPKDYGSNAEQVYIFLKEFFIWFHSINCSRLKKNFFLDNNSYTVIEEKINEEEFKYEIKFRSEKFGKFVLPLANNEQVQYEMNNAEKNANDKLFRLMCTENSQGEFTSPFSRFIYFHYTNIIKTFNLK